MNEQPAELPEGQTNNDQKRSFKEKLTFLKWNNLKDHSALRNLNKTDTADFLIRMGTGFITAGLILGLIVFSKPIYEELKYFVKGPAKNKTVVLKKEQPPTETLEGDEQVDPQKPDRDQIIAVDNNFSIIVPKIGANSAVIAQVNPYDSRIYQQALTRGVAHAQGTSLPGEQGNMFLFSHSSVNFWEANRYNSVFYLLNKLEKEDEIVIVFNDTIYRYKVMEIKTVDPFDVQYLKGDETKKTVTLMTCWPAGTTLNRLIVIGELIQ